MNILTNHSKRLELGLTLNDAGVLDTIHKGYEGSISSLHKVIGISDQTARNIVKKLRKMGYIEKNKLKISNKYLDSIK